MAFPYRLGLAYAGSNREDVLSLLFPVLSDNNSTMEVRKGFQYIHSQFLCWFYKENYLSGEKSSLQFSLARVSI